MLLNAIVLMCEVLYYSLFMRFARNEGKLYKYIVLFTLITIVGLVIGTNNLPSYLILILMIAYGLKFIVKIKVTLYDVFIIFIMLLMKLIIETPFYFLLQNHLNIYFIEIITGTFKILILLFIHKILNVIYLKLKRIWYKNNFYVRYLFAVLMFYYVISSCAFIILYYL